MPGTRFDQLRISTTLANAGLESYTDGSVGESAIRFSAGPGLTRTASGVEVDGSQSSMKTPCRVRTTANVADLAAGAPDPVDGVSLSVGDRVLVADQTTPAQDGIYVVDTVGTGVNGAWSRSDDAPTGGEAAGWFIQVLEGSTYVDTLFRVDANAGGATIGTDGWTVVSFAGATRTAGAGLVDGTGDDLDVNTGDGIAIASDRVVTQVSTATGAQQYGGLVRTRDADGSGAGTANAGYLAVQTDDSTLGISASNQLLVKSGGVTETQLNASVSGNGLTGGGGAALAVDPNNESGANITPVTVGANGVGLNVGDIDGTGLAAFAVTATASATVVANPSTATLTIGGVGLTAFAGARTPGSDDYNGTLGSPALIAADIIAAINDGANSFTGIATAASGGGAVVDLTAVPTGVAGNAVTLTTSDAGDITVSGALFTGGAATLRIAGAAAGAGLAGGNGIPLLVGAGTGITVNANDVQVDTTSTVTFVDDAATAWTFPVGTTAQGGFVTGTPQDANHMVNKTYVDNAATGLTWLDPVVCIDLIGNASVATINGLSPTESDSYVMTDAGTLTTGSLTVAAGDIVEFDGTGWVKIVTNSGGFPPSGTRMILKADGTTLVSPYTDPGDRAKIAVFGGASLTASLTTPTQNDAVLVVGNPGDTQPVDDNRAYVNDGGAGASASWIQFSGGGTTTAGTGATLDGNALNVNAGTSTNTFATILAQTDDLEVKIEAAGAGTGGLSAVSAGLRVDLEAAGVGAGGLELVAGGLAVIDGDGIQQTASGIAVDLEAAGAGTGGLAIDTGEIRINVDGTTTPGATAAVMSLNANGLAVNVDNSTVEASAAGGSLRVKDDGVVIAKLGLSYREEEFAASAFVLSSGNYVVSLGNVAIASTKSYLFNECYRNGVADLTNTSATDPTTATEYRVTASELQIGADITSTGNSYRVRYLSSDVV